MKEKYIPAALPEDFLRRMKKLLGEEYEDFLQSFETDRVQGLRLNTRKGEGKRLYEQNKSRFGLRPVPWCREGFYYQADTRPGRHPLHEAGVYYIQEPSAMAVVSLLEPQPGEKVLDLCAAPGGKTTHLADRLCGMGLLVSNEIHPTRAKILSRNVERMGICNAVVINEDSAHLADVFPEYFDRIVVDAPCSGEGMFRKDWQARSEWSEENVLLCAARQREILDNAARLLRPGGRMVYSTCTFSLEEDEGQIAQFLENHPEFSVVRVEEKERLPGLSAGMAGELLPKHPELEDTFRIWPHRAEGEGHYLALLEKSAKEESESENAGKSKDKKREQAEKIARQREKKRRKKPTDRVTSGRKGEASGFWKNRAGRQLLEEFVRDTLNLRETNAKEIPSERLYLFGEQLYLLPEQLPELDGLRVLRPGLHIGTLKKNRLEPSHALALALRPDQVKQTFRLETDTEEAADYLAGKTLTAKEGQKGWVLICAGEYPLGWGKAADGIVKNHYPKGLRITGAQSELSSS
jgi:NOL1/NOP2/sun family putative RNA methylase